MKIVRKAASKGSLVVAVFLSLATASCSNMLAFQTIKHLLDPSSKIIAGGAQRSRCFDVQFKKSRLHLDLPSRPRAATPMCSLPGFSAPSQSDLAKKAHSLVVSAFMSLALCAGLHIPSAAAENTMDQDQPKAESARKVARARPIDTPYVASAPSSSSC